MSKTMELTVGRLNEIQAEWMALESDAPEAVKRRVFTAMQEMPNRYLSVNRDCTLANVIDHGLPFFSAAQPIGEMIEWARKRGIQTRFGWQAEKWVELPNHCRICGGSHPVGCCAQDGHGG